MWGAWTGSAERPAASPFVTEDRPDRASAAAAAAASSGAEPESKKQKVEGSFSSRDSQGTPRAPASGFISKLGNLGTIPEGQYGQGDGAESVLGFDDSASQVGAPGRVAQSA